MDNTSTSNNEQWITYSDNVYFRLHEDDTYLFPFGAKELHSEEYLKWMNDLEITKTIGRFDYLMPVDRSKLINYYNNTINKDDIVFFAIYWCPDCQDCQSKKDGMKFVGTFKIYEIDLLARRASLGIVIGDKENWGKDIATKVIRMACQYIFDVLGLRKITAGFIGDNIGMERAFLKNGFEIEAVFKEQLYINGKFIDHKFVCKFRK